MLSRLFGDSPAGAATKGYFALYAAPCLLHYPQQAETIIVAVIIILWGRFDGT